MCVVSMIYDYGRERLPDWHREFITWPPQPDYAGLERRVKELEEQLRRAKQYDTENDQPDCELETKREALKDLAEKLGVEINFPGD